MKGALVGSEFRVLRGLSIATLCLSIFGVLTGGALAIMMGISSTSMSNPDIYNSFVQQLQSQGRSSSAFDGSTPATVNLSNMSDDQIRQTASTGFALIIAMSVGYVLCHVVGIIASMKTMRCVSDPQKLRNAFRWSMAATIVMILVGSFITGLLFIIILYMNNRAFRLYGMSHPSNLNDQNNQNNQGGGFGNNN